VAIEDYRVGQGLAIAQSGVDAAVGTARTVADVNIAPYERLLGFDVGANDRIGATVAGGIEVASSPRLTTTDYIERNVNAFNEAKGSGNYAAAGEVTGGVSVDLTAAAAGSAGLFGGSVGLARRVEGAMARRAAEHSRASTVLEAQNGNGARFDVDAEAGMPVEHPSLGNPSGSGAFSPVPESYMNMGHVLDMEPARGLPGSTLNTLGEVRNANYFWRQQLEQNPDMFSKGNKYKIEELGLSPKVDKTWAQHNPTHESFKGDVLHHHHLDRGRKAVPLPKTIHEQWTKDLHGDDSQ